ncbi:tRNA 2-selenouridine(34) synthase MnmH [Loktanella sp. Alg231-35]|uniref:tRNA 2-selenouridine(34) synthase MnmH n=1 Tax=Loktanella sp. Alg231-35 TaxID=1922220 RepID=UPI000D560C23|nr:tRNA 2-selenouridine(34) synthase MnmH [Loktanella sp. Alg231-35]
MPQQFTSLSAILNHGFDTVIDVRSPAEFAEDHLPGAVNLPALSNEQRAEVGTIYKQVSAFDARKLGAGMVVRNVADHIDGPLRDKDGAWRPLVYCWRGGQRSGVFTTLLSEIGWRAETIKGGYTSFRRKVKSYLYDDPLPHRFVLLDGYTGTAKTELLSRLKTRGVQVIDLEELAHHRGSLLGARPGGQPAQKGFETRLAVALQRCDPDRPVVIEAESSKIGRISLPVSVWAVMTTAPRIVVQAPIDARAIYLAQAYREVISDPVAVAEKLTPLRRLRGHEVVDNWIALSKAGALVELSKALMVEHYDPTYAKSRKIAERDVLGEITTNTLDADGQNRTADQIAAMLRGS